MSIPAVTDLPHSETGPARFQDGVPEYWIFGEQVTKDEFEARMPKPILKDGVTRWYLDGKLHRLYGPAVHGEGVESEYWFFGKQVSEKEFKKLPTVSTSVDYFDNYEHEGHVIQWKDDDDRLHREDGPAFIHPRLKLKVWYQHGRVHREGGPALEFDPKGMAHVFLRGTKSFPGDQRWFQEGYLHRQDGPAEVLADGTRSYWLRGERVEVIRKVRNDHVFWVLGEKFHRDDGPAFQSDTIEVWYKGGKVHRDDGPAIALLKRGSHVIDPELCLQGEEGDLFWVHDGRIHRDDGPAVIRSSGILEWWDHGQKIHESPAQSWLTDALVKAKWDAILSLFGALPSGHPLLQLISKLGLAAALHRFATTIAMKSFAAQAFRVSLTEGGFALIDLIRDAGPESLMEVVDASEAVENSSGGA